MKSYQSTLERIGKYVEQLYRVYQTPDLVYHNFSHTLNVMARSKEIAAHYDLAETEIFILYAAAWFHDVGHLFGAASGHEERSAEKMYACLAEEKISMNIINPVIQCIQATKFPGQPASLPARILCDADLYHLGTGEFIITDEQVKIEFGMRNNYIPDNWDEATLSFLQQHIFFTDYCKQKLLAGKERNIELLKERIAKK